MGWSEGLKSGWECGLNLLYPPREMNSPWIRLEPPFCHRCGLPVDGAVSGQWECGNCRQRPWHLETARAGFRMEGALREAIHGFKYQNEFDRLRSLQAGLINAYERFAREAQWEVLIPVPLHPLRQRERGFNQAEELARGLSRSVGLPVVKGLNRSRETPRQALLSRAARLRNLRDAFECLKPEAFHEKRVLLIDDVFTTGATANACARVLRKAGALQVGVLTVARG